MASGTIPVPMQVGYIDDSSAHPTVTAGSGNSTSIDSWIPTLPSGAKLFQIELLYWDSNSGAFSLVPYQKNGTGVNRAYFIANSGVSLVGAKCRWWYAITG